MVTSLYHVMYPLLSCASPFRAQRKTDKCAWKASAGDFVEKPTTFLTKRPDKALFSLRRY